MPIVSLCSRDARATVSTTAGMLLEAVFKRDGTTVAPFARAPWGPDPGRHRPAHLDVLGAEFVAVPFGSAGAPEALQDEWHGLVPAAPPDLPHGLPANTEWTLVAHDEAFVVLALDVPEGPVARLERRVALRSEAAAVDFQLTVHARRTGAVPVGLHPIFRLPLGAAALQVDAAFERGFTYPGVVPPGAGVAAPGRGFALLDAVPAIDGGIVDLTRLPLGRPVEDVLLLTELSEPVTLRFGDDGSGAVLDWDRTLLPSVLLWLSDRALGGDPWDHRYRGLGVEPVVAAFDLPPETSVGANPLSDAGVATAIRLRPAAPLVVWSSVSALFPAAKI